MATAVNRPFSTSSPLAGTLISPPPPSSSSPYTNHKSLPFPFAPPLLPRGCAITTPARRLSKPNPLHTQLSTINGNSSSRNSQDTSTSVGMGFFPIFRELGLDETEADALLHKHPPLAFASPASLREGLISLQSIGITTLAIQHLIIKRPELLISEEIIPFLDFVQEELRGLNPTKLERLLLTASVGTLPGFAGKVRLLLEHGIPPEKLVHVVNNVNICKVFCDRPTQVTQETILFLKKCGGIDLVLRRPLLLNLDLESQLIPRVEFLTELGGGDKKAAGILIRKLPNILAYSVDHYQIHTEFWRSVGLSDKEFFKIALVYPNVFSVSKERKLVPRIEFLRQCGMDANDIFKFLIKAPLFVSLSFEDNLAKKLSFLVKIGYMYRTREMALALGAVTRTSCENMQMVIDVFFSYGFSCQDVLAMSMKHPQVLQYNHESLEKKMEYLIGEMDREISELLAFPAFLGYKLDDRIKHRYEEKKETRGKGMSLNKLLSVSTKRFYSHKNSNRKEYDCYLDEVKD